MDPPGIEWFDLNAKRPARAAASSRRRPSVTTRKQAIVIGVILGYSVFLAILSLVLFLEGGNVFFAIELLVISLVMPILVLIQRITGLQWMMVNITLGFVIGIAWIFHSDTGSIWWIAAGAGIYFILDLPTIIKRGRAHKLSQPMYVDFSFSDFLHHALLGYISTIVFVDMAFPMVEAGIWSMVFIGIYELLEYAATFFHPKDLSFSFKNTAFDIGNHAIGTAIVLVMCWFF